MDITALSTVQQRADILEAEAAMDTGKENHNQMIEKTHIDAIDPNSGQNLDVIADKQMDKKDELHIQQQQEMKWARERQIMLNVKETKLLQMRSIAEQGKQLGVTPLQLRNLKHKLDNLASQISAIDSESRRTKNGEKLE
jgi:hypothetical protein